ncbi:TonB-dependent receptor [Spirosoma sp. BT702]|uniref:TonB-dependent receptor n=2 Tax=Spirosoma profusum TaxID=2771354 RepID=A0A927ASY6_9BACT|nr:TonB-dependent receptor [Spirosoma profusum]
MPTSAQVLAQNSSNLPIARQAETYRLTDAIQQLKGRYRVNILFEQRALRNLYVSAQATQPQASLEASLTALLQPLGLHYRKVKNNYVIVTGDTDRKQLSTTVDLTSATSNELIQPSTTPVHSVELQDDRLVTGRVTDEKGAGMPGVSVSIKNTTRGTTTDAEGKFRLSIPTGDGTVSTLVFSFVGYLNQELALGNRSSIDLQLTPDQKSLDEVVVVGYGTVKKSDLTGSLAQVKAKDLNAYPTTNVLQALSGRAAGVQVLQNTGAPGAPVSVRIRGTNSVQGSNEPLYVVDGFPLSGSNPTVLNNADIENIEILKDASATAIYGSRGANGVVIITTKRGKAGKTRVDFATSYSTQTLRKKLDLMNAQEYALLYNEQTVNDKEKPYFTQAQIDALGKGVDWQSLIFRQAPMKTATLTISGGTEKTRFAVSGSVFGQDGIIIGSNFNRYSLRANLSHEISKKVSLSLSSTLTRIQSDRKNNGGGGRGNTLISSILSAPPTLTPYKDDSTYRVFILENPPSASQNPLTFINEQTDRVKSNRVLTNAALEYKPLEGLSIRIAGGIENTDERNDAYTTRNFVSSQGSASVGTSQFTSLLSENTISYTKTLHQKHSLAAVAGFTYQNFLTTSLGASGTGFISDASQTYDIGSAITPGIPSSSYAESSLVSYLGRVNYAFNNKYLATISFRTDGSSKYNTGNKWGYFPSTALAWRVSNEDFFKSVSFISDLKVRAGWGMTGSQAIDAYATLNQLGSGKTVFDNALYTFYAPGTRLPGNLKWETTEQMDIGLEIGLMQNRFNVTADYYVKNTRDLLNTVQLPASLGFTTTIQNIGQVQNKGIELGIDAKILTGNLKWDVNANISFNRNKVVKLYNGQDVLGGTVAVTIVNDVANILREGRPIGQFWGYLEDGYDDKGKIKYKDLDGDGGITIKDKIYIGDPNPSFIYGFNSTLSYQHFDLSFFLQGVQGNDLFNSSSINNTIDYGNALNMPREVYLNHWTPINTTAKYPIISRSVSGNVSNRWIENGSYMRLKNIQIGYTIPTRKLGTNWIQSLQIYVSGQNLLTLTNYSWWDPEVNSNGGANSTAQGFDYFSYPTAKAITVGLRAGF